jgi:hypothetical protein
MKPATALASLKTDSYNNNNGHNEQLDEPIPIDVSSVDLDITPIPLVISGLSVQFLTNGGVTPYSQQDLRGSATAFRTCVPTELGRCRSAYVDCKSLFYAWAAMRNFGRLAACTSR